MRRSVWVSLALLGLAATVWIFARNPLTRAAGRPPAGRASISAEGSGSSQEIRALGAQLDALRAQVGSLQAQLARQSAEGKPPTEEVGTPGAEARPELSAEESESLRAAHIAEVEMSFENEARSPAWASDRRADIQAAVKGRALEQALGDIDCRTDTCRVEVTDNRKSDFAKELPVFLQQLGVALPSVDAAHVPKPDGSIKLVLYMSRSAIAAAER